MGRTAAGGWWLVLFLSLLLAGAGGSYGAESTEDVPVDAARKEKIRQQILGGSAQQPVDEEYRIGYRDILQVSVYGEGSMTAGEGIVAEDTTRGETGAGASMVRGRGAGIEVRIDGRVSLRHIGDVSVVGMTLTQLADYLKQLYAAIYDKPSVTVTLVQSNSQQYTVMGQVASPGLYHLDFPLTVVRAIARAGGFTEWANSEVTVIRQEDGQGGGGAERSGQGGRTFGFDYDDFLKGQHLEKNIVIRSGDVIVVH